MIRAGVMLGERYEVLERIGSGGMAEVYRGRDHKLNRMIAIKVLKREFREDESFIKNFTAEAQSAAGLMHPNVVNVYDVGEDRGLYFMVMELVEGITLKQYIEKKGKLSAKEVLSIAIQMCTGVEAAHKHHIIHRDIKPQNIIISKEGKVKVTDFGIAKAASSETVHSNAMGSVHYTSPEQAKGGISDEKSDVYSVGVTIYEMITGVVPFDGDSTVNIALQHLQTEASLPSEYAPNIPHSLEQIILKCMQKNPDMRYADMSLLIMDLKRSLIDPNGDFVVLGAGLYGSDTVMITPEELSHIQKEGEAHKGYDEDDYDEEFDEEDYDEDEESYDDDDYDDYGDEDEERRPKNSEVNPNTAKVMKILAIVIGVIIVFVAVMFIGKAVGIFKFPSTEKSEVEKKIEVPNLVGQETTVAKTMLEKKGLKLKVTGENASDKKKGVIISQTQESGERVEKGTEIEVVVSSGQAEANVKIPNLVGQSEEAAQKSLEDAGLKVEWEYDYNGSVGTGDVISTDPKAGTMVAEGSTVKVKVSKGEDTIKLPSVTGKTQADATAELEKLGLKVGNVTEENSKNDVGIVIAQGISANTWVARGTAVDLVISKGPKEVKVTVPPISGKAEATAISLLDNAGLKYTKKYQYSDSVKTGYVISADPGDGASVNQGAEITIVISQGKEPAEPPTDPDKPTDPNKPENPGTGNTPESSGNGTAQ